MILLWHQKSHTFFSFLSSFFFFFLFFFLRLLEYLSQERVFLNESIVEPNGWQGEPSGCSLSFLLMENLFLNVQGNDSDAPGTQRNRLQNLLCQQDLADVTSFVNLTACLLIPPHAADVFTVNFESLRMAPSVWSVTPSVRRWKMASSPAMDR